MATRRQAVIGLFFVTLLWGGTFVWMKQAMNSLEVELDEYSKAGVVGVIVATRFLIAFVALLPFSSRARAALTSKEDWKGGLILGSLMLAGFVLQMIGIESVTPSVSAFLTSLYVVFTAILSVKISDRKPTRMMVAGVLLATLGAGFIDGPSSHRLGNGGDTYCDVRFLLCSTHYLHRFDHQKTRPSRCDFNLIRSIGCQGPQFSH
ncbi:MAG: DMT family transporter [Candidatus Poseidoniaceae archaeon]